MPTPRSSVQVRYQVSSLTSLREAADRLARRGQQRSGAGRWRMRSSMFRRSSVLTTMWGESSATLVATVTGCAGRRRGTRSAGERRTSTRRRSRRHSGRHRRADTPRQASCSQRRRRDRSHRRQLRERQRLELGLAVRQGLVANRDEDERDRSHRREWGSSVRTILDAAALFRDGAHGQVTRARPSVLRASRRCAGSRDRLRRRHDHESKK
jgi:hypothetical protein